MMQTLRCHPAAAPEKRCSLWCESDRPM